MSAAKAMQQYVDFLMQEWRLDKQSDGFQARVRRVLLELEIEVLLALRREPKLEVRVASDRLSVWAYFPMHPRLQTPRLRIPKRGTVAEYFSAILAAKNDVYRRRLIAQKFKPAPSTKVTLLFDKDEFEKQPRLLSENQLRDHLGHVLLYLRDPKAPNECTDAAREWRALCRRPRVRSAKAKARDKN